MNDSRQAVTVRALNLAAEASLARQNLVMFGVASIAALSLPDSLTGWDLFWLIVSVVLTAIALTNIHLAHRIDAPGEALPHILISFGAGLAAVITSMTIRPISGVFLAAMLVVLSITIERRPFVTAALTIIGVPWWIWLAGDEWHWQLLGSLPIIALGLLAVSHLLDAHAWPQKDERILSSPAHRYACWIAIALTGIGIILVGMFTGLNRPWLALAGIVLAAAIPLEAGFGTTNEGSAVPGLRIVSGAYLVAIACWLIAIE